MKEIIKKILNVTADLKRQGKLDNPCDGIERLGYIPESRYSFGDHRKVYRIVDLCVPDDDDDAVCDDWIEYTKPVYSLTKEEQLILIRAGISLWDLGPDEAF